MSRIPKAYWASLREDYPSDLLDAVSAKLKTINPLALTVEDIGAEIDTDADNIRRLLDRLAGDGHIERSLRHKCRSCESDLDQDSLEEQECQHCNAAIDHSPPIEYVVYSREGQASRDSQWVILVHGMNTHGAWQEDFSWKLAKLYGYAVPVAIYKYGRILFSPVLLFRQRRYRDDLIKKINALQKEMVDGGYSDRPDVVAHSFGTWLLAQALITDPKIRLGRVILTGSIVRPDYDWAAHINAGRVEAVLCHYGRRDIPVRLSQFVIPNSGPSGYLGFNDHVSIVHIVETDYGHSDYFKDENMQQVMEERWSKFLNWPADRLPSITSHHDNLSLVWRRSRFQWVSHPAKYVILLASIAMILVGVIALYLGFMNIFL